MSTKSNTESGADGVGTDAARGASSGATSVRRGITWGKPGTFVLVLGVLLLGLSEKMPDLGPGLLRGDPSSWFAFALVAGLVGCGVWWLRSRDRRRAGDPVGEASIGAGETRSLLREVTNPPLAEKPSPTAAAAAVAAFQEFLRTVTPRVWVVPAIIGANVAVYVAMVATGVAAFSPSGSSMLAWGASYGPRTLGGEPWRVLTSVFLHFGAVHLLMNMYVLWSVGPLVERIYGPARFAALYFAAGVCGSIASLLIHPQVLGAGASGAVFGVYGALGAFLLLERGAIPGPVVSRLGRVAMAFVGYNVLYGLTNSEIDMSAHLGGLLGGAASGAWLAQPLSERSRSTMKPLIVTALAAFLVPAAPVFLPKPADLSGTLNRFISSERQLQQRYDGLVKQAREGRLHDPAFASLLEESVIGPWSQARRQLSAAQHWSPPQQKVIDLFIRYATEREEAWKSRVVSLRGHDAKALEESKSHWAESERLVEQINHLP